MSRDQRINDNWALIYAQKQAIKRKESLLVVFNLTPSFLGSTLRQYSFMLNGLKKLASWLEELNIPFFYLQGEPEASISEFTEKYEISELITDFSPLKIKKQWIEKIKEKVSIPIKEVDAHNIIPCWEASDKKEYAAYTFRSKLKQKLSIFLDNFPKISEHKYTSSFEGHVEKIDSILPYLDIDQSVKPVEWLSAGEDHAYSMLEKFLKNSLPHYNERRNDPNVDGTSNLSPYLHFGQISAQRVVLEAQKQKPIGSLKGTFYDEIIVRRELSDNYCYYEENYDNIRGFPDWGRKTIDKHKSDSREYTYSLREFENATTHDKAWNAAQLQMKDKGKMQGYMRMYWGKKILEWTDTPEKAMEIAIYLNDKYELDGRDPNGYAGIAWSIGGVHDRAWKERNVYGKVRFMSFNGLKRKFDLENYIQTYGG